MDKRFNAVDKRLNAIDTKIANLDSSLSEFRAEMRASFAQLQTTLGSEIVNLKVGLNEVKTQSHQTAILVEQQAHDNKLVMEGYAMLWRN